MAASAAGARQPRRGPAPIASFDHDGSDESSPEGKLAARLPEIREGAGLAPPEPRARSHSTPAAAAGALPAPRIDISRASSSSHHDSRDSSPELALFAGAAAGEDRARLELGFREDGALDLRSSTEELAFLEPAPGEPAAPPAPPRPPAPPPPPPTERRHSRKDSQGSEAALLAVSGRTSRISSVGSQCSARSALSRVSRLSVVSGASRSPSPHRMLLETSFCGPKPIETDPEISAGELVEQILGLGKIGGVEPAAAAPAPAVLPPAPAAPAPAPAPIDARDRREVRTEVTVESARSAPAAAVTVAAPPPAPPPDPPAPAIPAPDAEKNEKETTNRTRTEERKARPRLRREPSEPEVYKSQNRSKVIIRIKLKPDDSCEEEEAASEGPAAAAGEAASEAARPPATLELAHAARPAPPSPAPSRRRSPSPAGPPVSRKSSFCSLFKSRETIASPESPSEALRRKRSLTEGRSRSKSRDRSATPTSASKIRGSVLSLFRTPRRSGPSPAPGSPVAPARALAAGAVTPADRRRADRLKYYEDTKDGIIHIPLRTPPDEVGAAPAARRSSGGEPAPPPEAPREPRPASAPQPRALPDPSTLLPDPPAPPAPPRPEPEPRPLSARAPPKPIHRTVLPDGSIIIPLHSPTERAPEPEFPEIGRGEIAAPAPRPAEEPRAVPARSTPSTAAGTPTRASDASPPRERPPPDAPAPEPEDARRRRHERLVFTTHVGSREQVFSTQFSITKTPSVTSEISGSFPSFAEGAEARAAPLRDSRIGASPPPAAASPPPGAGWPPPGAASPLPGAGSPRDASPAAEAPRDSSESEPSSEAAPSRAGNDVEKRGLVVQESFEEELPYVPTTLPQERSVAVPMVPVRERGGVRVSSVQRPRAAPPPARAPAPPPPPPPPPDKDKLRIKLPRRPRPASASAARPRSGSGDARAAAADGEARAKAEWIDFEEVPERRKQPKRIQTLPAGAVSGAAAAGGVIFSYVEPEHCRCECHAHARPDDTLPLLRDEMQTSINSSSSAECGEPEPLRDAAGS